MERSFAMRTRSTASAHLPSRLRGKASGSPRARAVTCRRPAAMHADASSTAITHAGVKCATPTNSTAWLSSGGLCPESEATWHAPSGVKVSRGKK